VSEAGLGAYAWVADLAYGEGETRLGRDARAAGCRVVDGLEILVRQGALSFERWTGRQAPLDAMRAAVHPA
jgi:shikimate dehydrogenase